MQLTRSSAASALRAEQLAHQLLGGGEDRLGLVRCDGGGAAEGDEPHRRAYRPRPAPARSASISRR